MSTAKRKSTFKRIKSYGTSSIFDLTPKQRKRTEQKAHHTTRTTGNSKGLSTRKNPKR